VFDYDDDGDLDVFVVQGGMLVNSSKTARAKHLTRLSTRLR